MILAYPPKTGTIVLIGGGEIPNELSSYTGSYLIISTDVEYAKTIWPHILNVKKIILPEQLSYDDIAGLSGIVICGGDQWQYLNRLNSEIIQYAYESGLNIIGTSAGAMILGEYFFSAERGGITSEEACAGKDICLGKNFVCLEPLKGCIIDSHYSQRNRSGRLKVFVDNCGADIGLGIDEGTALEIKNNGICRIFGKGTVWKIFRKNP
jgi:cyanophycinase-like exopeptidase